MSVVTRNPAVEAAILGDELVLFDERSGHMHVLNASGALVWELLEGRTVEQVAQAVAATTGAPIGNVREGVRAFVAELRQLSIVEER
jgi:PqqD family protein of HPr-rel-A system